MLLKRLTLHNIRSYIDETIDFPSGSILLSGDIGSGKSSILLALEFALFGTSPSELPAEAVMRKGAVNASVELTFILNSSEITIKRNLKKEKKGIKQTAGYIIINNLKKDLTATELKAEIVNLLGYPEDSIEKSKNYLFRYSVYTPQEEMKLILHEAPEVRLDVLRKIFDLDKYKNIRENLQPYLKTLRSRKASLEEKIFSLDALQSRITEIISEKANKIKELQLKDEELKQLKVEIILIKTELEMQGKNQMEIQELKQELKAKTYLREDKNIRLGHLESSLNKIERELLGLKIPEGTNHLVLIEEIKRIEAEINKLTFIKANVSERINQTQKNIKKLNEEISSIEKEAKSLEEKNKLKNTISEEIKELVFLE